MSSFDDYEDEMARNLGLSEPEIDRLFASQPVEGADGLTAFMGVARYALMEEPSEELTARHLAAIAQAARTLDKAAPAPDKSAPQPTAAKALMDKALRVGFRVAAGLVAAVSSMVGLAYAGVDLPGTTTARALEAVLHVHLPNQADDGPGEGPDVKSESQTDVVTGDLTDGVPSDDQNSGNVDPKSVSDDVHAVEDSPNDRSACEHETCAGGDGGAVDSGEPPSTTQDHQADAPASGDGATTQEEADRGQTPDASPTPKQSPSESGGEESENPPEKPQDKPQKPQDEDTPVDDSPTPDVVPADPNHPLDGIEGG
jgi:hypothetical protein